MEKIPNLTPEDRLQYALQLFKKIDLDPEFQAKILLKYKNILFKEKAKVDGC